MTQETGIKDNIRNETVRQAKIKPDQTRHNKIRHDEIRPGKTRLEKAEQGKTKYDKRPTPPHSPPKNGPNFKIQHLKICQHKSRCLKMIFRKIGNHYVFIDFECLGYI